MPLSDSELKGLKAGAKRKVVSAGDSLFVVVESVGKGGGTSSAGPASRLGDRANRLRCESVPTEGVQANGP